MKVALIIIFNHRFDSNIDRIRRLYGGRFSNIRFLIPFYDGNDKDCIPVYESSYRFQGYIAQSYVCLKELKCDYMFFIGDDVILHPDINENTLLDYLKMESKKAYIHGLRNLYDDGVLASWYHAIDSSVPFYNSFVNWKNYLPTYEDAISKMKEFWGTDKTAEINVKFYDGANRKTKRVFDRYNRKSKKIVYPMAFGYSDIFCIESSVLERFAKYCGVFAAMGLFVEIAIPTALMLICSKDEIQTRNNTNMSSYIIWDENEKERFASNYQYSVNNLYSHWENWIYVHPVKLSRWDID